MNSMSLAEIETEPLTCPVGSLGQGMKLRVHHATLRAGLEASVSSSARDARDVLWQTVDRMQQKLQIDDAGDLRYNGDDD